MFSFLKVSDLGSPTSSTSFIITSLPLLSLVAVTSLLYVLSTFFLKEMYFKFQVQKMSPKILQVKTCDLEEM